jgi:hypothetical protein
MFNNRLKVSIGVLTLLVVLCLVTDGPAPAQFGFSIVSASTSYFRTPGASLRPRSTSPL